MRKSDRFFRGAFVAATFLAALGAATEETTRAEEQRVAFRRAETFEDAHAASCRVSVPGARGSGFFIGAVGKDGYVLTNYHVVTRSRDAKLDFWTNGRQETILGRVEGRYFDASTPADFALVVVDVDALKAIDPPFLALGGADAKPSVGATIVSSGAPEGRFPQAWKGRVVEYFNDRTAVFAPPPVPGQSGSPICEHVAGELFVTGILTWLVGERGQDDSKGGAIPIMNLYQSLNRPEGRVDAHSSNGVAIPPQATECGAATTRCETGDSAREFEDFRTRAPIQDHPDDKTIFKISERRWRDRGANQPPQTREQPPQEDDAKGNEPKFRPQIGEKIKDGALDAFSKKIESKLAERIDAVKRELLEKWNSVKLRLFMTLCLILTLARLVADAFAKLARTAWSRIIKARAAAAQERSEDGRC